MANDKSISFGRFRLDLANECLWQGPEAIRIRPKAFAVLNYLVVHSGQLVTKDELLSAVWPQTFVSDAVLKVTIRQLREALNDDPRSPQFIETAHRRGYRFIGQVADSQQQDATRHMRSLVDQPVGVVGRDAPLLQMRRWLQTMLDGERQIVFVTGEAGIGKTALVDSFAGSIPKAGNVRIGRGQCLEQYGTSEAYLPVLEAIGRLCREDEQVIQVLRAHAPMWLLQMPSLIEPAERELLSKELAGATRERMLREIGEALAVLTSELPLVLILEDLHWSDYSTLDLISYLASQRESGQLMLIGTYRNVELIVSGHPLKAVKQEMLAKQQCKELPLEYLSQEAVYKYLLTRFPGGHFPMGLAELIHERTDGNPLFMVNAVDYVVGAGLIGEQGNGWGLVVDLGSVVVEVPDNVKQMIEKQVGQLDVHLQRMLEVASVAGVEFSSLAVVAGSEDPQTTVEAQLDRLARQRQFIHHSGVQELPSGDVVPRYGFVHALYQNVLYERLPVSRRVQLHRQIGERGEQIFGDRACEIASELAMHFERGRDWKRAAQYFEQSARNAIRRFAYQEAVELARHGIALLNKAPDSVDRASQELSLYLTLGVPLISIEGYAAPSVGEVYMRARELYERLGDTPDVSEVLWGLWTFHTLRAELTTARQIADEFLRLAERLPYPGLSMLGHWAMEITFTHQGELSSALEHYEKALALYHPERHLDDSLSYALNPGVAMPCFAAWAHWLIGHADESLKCIEKALTLARQLSEPHGLAHAVFFAAVLYQLRRDPGMAQQYADQVIAISREHGLVMYKAMATIIRGWSLAEEQREDEAVAVIREGLAGLEATRTALLRPHFLALLSIALSKADQTEEALAVLDESISLAHNTDESLYEPELYRLKGQVLFRQATGRELEQAGKAAQMPIGNLPGIEDVERCFEQSLKIAKTRKAILCELRTSVSLAKFYQWQGKQAVARDLVARVYDQFTEGFDTKDLQAAKAILN